ncbi:Kynurenine formamidase [Escovopsis weberi]|uniref:Kynurenine formamidase n=1 Tax=Escovopsis weberi TaxID=150374 RepID=A0A0M8N4E9_ESCWE|nr:Kynurenine formamidase [Escovopsis weberi]
MASHDIAGLEHTVLQYGDHALQRIGIWQHPQAELSSDPSCPWIVFIHGGGWRDPRNSLYDFVPSIKHVLSSTTTSTPPPPIRGFASIDYRLSPHPLFPQDPAATPPAELRAAKHPDHLDDVRSAIALLASRYRVGTYILIGHSAGATLAYQPFMAPDAAPHIPTPVPAGIIGIAGVYDLTGLCARKDGYEGFIGGAFGDRAAWDAASPAKFRGSFAGALAGGAHVSVLAASPADSLVDMPELEAMLEKLRGDGVDVVAVRDLTGEHDQIWQEGTQVANLVIDMLNRLS